jgi:hypothetical protein
LKYYWTLRSEYAGGESVCRNVPLKQTPAPSGTSDTDYDGQERDTFQQFTNSKENRSALLTALKRRLERFMNYLPLGWWASVLTG